VQACSTPIAWLIDRHGPSVCRALLTTSMNASYIAGICPPSSARTIIVVVPAQSPNNSSQFVLEMKRYEGIPKSPDSKPLSIIGSSPGIQYSFHVSACRQHLHAYTLGNLLLAVAAAAPCLPVQCLVSFSPLQMLSTVTPSSPIRTTTSRTNVQTTSSLAP